jgi:hypothetical protein
MSLLKDENRTEFKANEAEYLKKSSKVQLSAVGTQSFDLLGGGRMKQVWVVRDRRLGGRPWALAEMIDSFRTDAARIAPFVAD